MAVKSYGPVEQLELIEIPEPALKTGQVLVRVRGSAVNPADSKVITGKVKMLLTDFKTGDRVFGHLPYGGSNRQGAFSEKIAVQANSIAKMPRAFSFDQAGACATGALTALQALRKTLENSSGKRVLVNGAHVTATCSRGSMDFVKSVDKNLRTIAQWAGEKKLRAPIEKTYALKDVSLRLASPTFVAFDLQKVNSLSGFYESVKQRG